MSNRSELFINAKSFLRDSNVRNSPIYKQISFLESKGLTREEINTLLDEVKSTLPSQQQFTTTSSSTIPTTASNAFSPSPSISTPLSSENHFNSHFEEIKEKLKSQNLPLLPPEIELKIRAGQLTAPNKWSWKSFFLYLALLGGILAALKRYIINDSWSRKFKTTIKRILFKNDQNHSKESFSLPANNENLKNEIIQLRYMLNDLTNKVDHFMKDARISDNQNDNYEKNQNDPETNETNE